MLYGTILRVPGKFFIEEERSEPNEQIFFEKFRNYMARLCPTPTADHIRPSSFVFKNLHSCTYVFLRENAARKPLRQPYSEPFKVVNRNTDRVFTIRTGPNTTIAVSTKRLKPAYMSKEDVEDEQRKTARDQQKARKPATSAQSVPAASYASMRPTTPVLQQSPSRFTLQATTQSTSTTATRKSSQVSSSLVLQQQTPQTLPTQSTTSHTSAHRFSSNQPMPIRPCLLRNSKLHTYCGPKCKKSVQFVKV